LLQKIAESLKTLWLPDETAEVLRAFEKMKQCTAGLLWVDDEHNIGGALNAMRTTLDEIQGLVDFVISLMPPPPGDLHVGKREAQRRWALKPDPDLDEVGKEADFWTQRHVFTVTRHSTLQCATSLACLEV
jgi:hypothetical protein